MGFKRYLVIDISLSRQREWLKLFSATSETYVNHMVYITSQQPMIKNPQANDNMADLSADSIAWAIRYTYLITY